MREGIGALQKIAQGRIARYSFFVSLLALAVLAYFPILSPLHFPARGDWDLAFFNNAVPFITIKEYCQIPLWNPFYCGGFSYIGSPDSTLFSLQTVFSLLAQDVIVATKINVVFHALIGLAGMWFLCRHLGFQFWAILLAAVIFVFNGCMSSHIGEGPLDWFSIFFLPWILLFFLKSQDKKIYVIFTGLCLALMFCDRGGYTFIFSVLFLGVFATVQSLCQKKATPLLCLVGAIVFWAGFSAPKLFPLLSTMSEYPRLVGPGKAFDVVKLLQMYIFRNPNPFGSLPKPFTYWGWWEFNAYVGMIPAALFLGGLALKKYLPWSICAGIFFMISVGNFGPWSLWKLLHQAPVFNTMQIPNRDNFVFVFIAAILAGAFLQRIQEWTSKSKLILFLAAVLAMGVVVDLVGYTYMIFQRVPRPYPSGRMEFLKAQPFEQIELSRRYMVSGGAWSRMYDPVWQNKGLINGYFKVPFKRCALGRQDKGYQGEVYFKNRKGNAQMMSWSPNKISYKYELSRPDRLVINQNFDKNWQAQGALKVESFKGLLSIPLDAGTGSVTLYYSPVSFWVGVLVFGLTVILSILFIRSQFLNILLNKI